jgi:hypothetical protein
MMQGGHGSGHRHNPNKRYILVTIKEMYDKNFKGDVSAPIDLFVLVGARST